MRHRRQRRRQLTIRWSDPALDASIHALAKAEDLSLNQAVVRLLRKGAGLAPLVPSGVIGNALDHLAGTWTKARARAFDESLADFERIDPEKWR